SKQSISTLLLRFGTTAITARLAACNADLRTIPVQTASTSVQGGDHQLCSSAAPLRDPLVIKVVDADGNPVIGTSVHWTTRDGGSFSPADAHTDARGIAQTTWTLGASGGDQHAQVIVAGATSVAFSAS